MSFYDGETRSPDFKPDRFGYTIDTDEAEAPVEDDEEAQAGWTPEAGEK